MSVDRRQFLSACAAVPILAAQKKLEPRADTMILLWMAGGMAQTETFDPKRYTPFETGLESKAVLSTFPAIDTAVDPIKISKGLERIGAVMDRGALIRTYQAADLGHILHSRHQYHWHTGYAPPQSVACPHIGAWIAKVLGPRNPDVPAFIDIGQSLRDRRGKRRGKSISHGRLPRKRIRPLPHPESGGGGRERAPPTRHDS